MKKLIFALLFALLLCVPAMAEGVLDEQYEAYGSTEVEGALPDAARDIMGDAGVRDTLDVESFMSRIWGNLKDKFSSILTESVGSAVAIVAVALLCGVISQLAMEEAPKYVTFGGVIAVAVIAVAGSGSFIRLATDTLDMLTSFSHTLLPCLCTSAAAGGAVGSAAAKYAATALFMDIFITATRSIVVPLIYTYLAASVASAAMDSPALGSAAALLKWLCNTSMTIIMTAFTVYLAVTGVISGSADVLASKAAKTAISTVLPVVGGIISDAAGTVVAGAGLVCGAIGVFGLGAVLCICLVPFLRLGMRYLLFKAAAMLAGSFADSRMSSLVGSVSSAFGMLTGMVGSGAIMLFFAIVSMIKAVGG